MAAQRSRVGKKKGAPSWHRQGFMIRRARWRKVGFPRVEAPTGDSQELLADHKVEDMVADLKKRLPEHKEKEVWLEQLSALVKIAEEDYSSLYGGLETPVKNRLKTARLDFRKMIVHVIWGFTGDNDDDVTWDDFSRELACLTSVVLGRIKRGDDAESVYGHHQKAVGRLISLDDATTALSNSSKVYVGSVGIRTFIITEDDGSTSASITSMDTVGR
jgi:hypothetical protein